MATKVGDIMFPNGHYEKDGEEKTAWLKCGVLLNTEKGYRIKLDALPVNMQEGWFSVFEDNKDAGYKKPAAASGEQGAF